jgi:hypothetical protein
MSSLIHAVGHALTGHGDNSDKKSNVHTVVYEDVKVKSIVSSETQSKGSTGHSQNKIHELMAKLGTINKVFFKIFSYYSNHFQVQHMHKLMNILDVVMMKYQKLLKRVLIKLFMKHKFNNNIYLMMLKNNQLKLTENIKKN